MRTDGPRYCVDCGAERDLWPHLYPDPDDPRRVRAVCAPCYDEQARAAALPTTSDMKRDAQLWLETM